MSNEFHKVRFKLLLEVDQLYWESIVWNKKNTSFNALTFDQNMW